MSLLGLYIYIYEFAGIVCGYTWFLLIFLDEFSVIFLYEFARFFLYDFVGIVCGYTRFLLILDEYV